MRTSYLLLFAIALGFTGCTHPKITAFDLNGPKPVEVGMPYYLPKYYLVVSKNVKYIPTPTVGLTASRNEVEVSEERRDDYHLYRLFSFRVEPRLFTLAGSLRSACRLEPMTYSAVPY